MDRDDAIRKVKAMRNPNGRTPDEAAAFQAKALEIMAAHSITEAEISGPAVFDFDAFRRRTSPEHEDFMAAIRRQAEEAAFMARQAARNAWTPPADRYSRPKPKAKRPNRGAYAGNVRHTEVDPQVIRVFMRENGIRTNGQLANLAGVSPSLVSEWMGKGRQRLVSKTNWEAIYKPAILRNLGR